uniref:Uncharacterized protein n=3 Tax=Ciona intestinalis TaxID=7719 RepID=H2XUC6_CIOIN
MQMQMSSSARKVLDNVLTRQMDRPNADPQPNEATAKAAASKSARDKADPATKMPSKPVLTHHPPPTANVLTNPAATNSANIREKLRQHYRHNASGAQTRTSKKENQNNAGNYTDSQSTNNNSNMPYHSTTVATNNGSNVVNENILNKIRQKGPVIAKRFPINNNGEIESGVAAIGIKKETDSSVPHSLHKGSSRPGSPRTPRRRSSPIPVGRTSPFSKRVPSPTSRGLIKGRNPSPKG